MVGDCKMISPVGFSVQSGTTGTTSSEHPSATQSIVSTYIFISIRAKIRDCIDGYNAFDDYWLRCLYEGEEGDPEDVEKGFLKSTLLVKVRTPPSMLQY